MTKILCLFGVHTFEYEESVLTGKGGINDRVYDALMKFDIEP